MTIEQFVNEAVIRHIVTQGREKQLTELLEEYQKSNQPEDEPKAVTGWQPAPPK